MSEEIPIRLELAGGIATLTLCRPARKNVITHRWAAALQEHADWLHEAVDLRCVLIQADGPMFSVGADVKEMAAQIADMAAYVDSLIAPVHQAMLRLASLPVPVVGLLRGTAAGGGAALALQCDVLVAARSARLVIAYPQLGTTSDMGLSHALIERLGAQRALQLFLLSDSIDMDQAERLGLVHQVVDDGEAESAVHRVVQRLVAMPSRAAKELFLHGRQAVLAERLEREHQSFLQCSRTPEFREGVLAFANSRRQVLSGSPWIP